MKAPATKKKPAKPLYLRLSEETDADVRSLAHDQNLSITAIINLAVRNGLPILAEKLCPSK